MRIVVGRKHADAAQLKAELEEKGIAVSSAVVENGQVVLTLANDSNAETVALVARRHFPNRLIGALRNASTQAEIKAALVNLMEALTERVS